MNILQICHKPPFPPVDGGCIAMNNITQGLLEFGATVKVLAINTFKHPLNIDALPDDYRRKTQIETEFIDTRIKLEDVFLNFFSGESYNIRRFYSGRFEKKIAEVLKKKKFDIIHLESLFTTPYLNLIRKNSKAKIVYRAHNIEFEIWERVGETEKKYFKKKYLQFLSRRMKNYEISLLNKYDGIAAISNEDAQKFLDYGCRIPVQTIPFGINFSEYQTSKNSAEENLFFLGAMDWQPNCEAVEWFLKTVWNEISQKFPQLKFNMAGRAMPDKFFKMNSEKITVSGEIPNAKKFFQQNDIMIVPLLNGSGIRVKIIEAMAMGKIIISTAVGAKGIPCEHKKNILIANSAAEFSEMISLILQNSEIRKTISENARKFAEENYDNRKITEKLVSFYRQISHS